MRIFEKTKIEGLRPNKWPIVREEAIRKEDAPYLYEIVKEAKEYIQRPKDFYLAWEKMLAMKSINTGLPATSSLTLSEALYVLFLEVPYNDVRKHYDAFSQLVVR